MTEDYLHYVWKYGLFSNTSNDIVIISPGELNNDSGPDFFNAKIKIAETIWAGNVEIHIKSSFWNTHNHQHDKAYDNVVLHVVYDHDKEITDSNGRVIPVLELKGKINLSKFEDYKDFVKPSLPCLRHLHDVPSIIITNTKERALIERLEDKCENFKKALIDNNKDWEETFYQYLAKSLGSGLNSDNFFLLAKHTPLRFIRKLEELYQIESMLFGVAGLIKSENDKYQNVLQNEFNFFQRKYNLNQLKQSSWKFSKIRPSNFPTIRIAQLAKLLLSQQNLFDSCIKSKPTKVDLYSFFNITLDDGYWFDHYVFGKQSKTSKKSFGKKAIDNIIINVIVPISFFYGDYIQDLSYRDYAFELLEELDFETNRYTKKFDNKVEQKSAYDSQSLIQLYKNYCSNKKCLNCGIGNEILK